MRKLVFSAILLAATIVSCSKIQSDTQKIELQKDEAEYYEEFAVLLSKAAASQESLRSFLKVQALEQFDCDYDVFYPLVKNKVVDGTRTFREILSEYDAKNILPEIEQNLPYLNILVPDWGWAGAFSVEDWDSSCEELSVMYMPQEGDKANVYTNGSKEGELRKGEIPTFPIVIVGHNDRMKLETPTTKGADAQYGFIDDIFDPSKNIQTKCNRHQYYEEELETEPCNDLLTASQVGQINIDAFKQTYDCQRDYVYYGITTDNETGNWNDKASEVLYKLRINCPNCDELQDDFSQIHAQKNYKGRKSPQTDFILNDLLYEGQLEFYIDVYVMGINGSISNNRRMIAGNILDFFQPSSLKVDFQHKTLFTPRKWTYSIDMEKLEPRWFEVNMELTPWDLSKESAISQIQLCEWDNSRDKVTYVAQIEYKFANNVTGNSKSSLGISYNIHDFDYCTYQNTLGSWNLGMIRYNYSDRIIRKEVPQENGETLYKVSLIDNGIFSAIILPREI